MQMSTILHITHRQAWEASIPGGIYRPASLDAEGFIHCSAIGQAVETANLFFANQTDLLLLCIDVNKTEAEVKYEAPTGGTVHDGRTGSLFPHLYGPLHVSAVVRVVPFPPGADGKFVLPADIGQLRA
jgi:uncharacterized protein (DUF952 family)